MLNNDLHKHKIILQIPYSNKTTDACLSKHLARCSISLLAKILEMFFLGEDGTVQDLLWQNEAFPPTANSARHGMYDPHSTNIYNVPDSRTEGVFMRGGGGGGGLLSLTEW